MRLWDYRDQHERVRRVPAGSDTAMGGCGVRLSSVEPIPRRLDGLLRQLPFLYVLLMRGIDDLHRR